MPAQQSSEKTNTVLACIIKDDFKDFRETLETDSGIISHLKFFAASF